MLRLFVLSLTMVLFLMGTISRAQVTIDVESGYRFLEGGANVGEVYNFTLVQFAVAGLFIQL